MPAPPPVPVTDVMVMLTRKPGVSMPDLMKVLPEEARETMLLYLDGKIDQWYSRADGKGVVFFLRCTTVEEAKAIMGGLPLDKAGMWIWSIFRWALCLLCDCCEAAPAN